MSRCANARGIVLTIRKGDEEIHRALRSGASTYLPGTGCQTTGRASGLSISNPIRRGIIHIE